MIPEMINLFLVLCDALLVPVVLGLAVLMAAMLWGLGGLIGEALSRRAVAPRWRSFLSDLQEGRAEADSYGRLGLAGYPARFQARVARQGPGDIRELKKALDDLEIDVTRRLAPLSFATRVGPMLGLVGTLLPLGPALKGLEAGSIGTLAANLQIAFTTTVCGLLIGGLAYAISLVRRSWYEQDLSDLDYVADRIQRCADADPGHSLEPCARSSDA